MIAFLSRTFTNPSTSSLTFFAKSSLVVIRIAVASSSCSAWITDQLPHTVDWLSHPPIPVSRSVLRWNRCLHYRILLFLQRYIDVSRSYDFVYFRNAFCSESKGSDCLCTTYFIDFICACFFCSDQTAGFTFPSALHGVVMMIFSTPATFAGIMFIRTDDGYTAFPPGT